VKSEKEQLEGGKKSEERWIWREQTQWQKEGPGRRYFIMHFFFDSPSFPSLCMSLGTRTAMKTPTS